MLVTLWVKKVKWKCSYVADLRNGLLSWAGKGDWSRERMIVLKGKSYCSRRKGFCFRGGYWPWGLGETLEVSSSMPLASNRCKYVPIKCMKDLAYFVIHNAIATLHTPKCHKMLVPGKLFLLQCKIPGLINAHLSIC